MKIGLVNGCWDLFHDGHKLMLATALSNCDHLVIAMNSDASVKRLKGKERPINDWHTRFWAIYDWHLKLRLSNDREFPTIAIIPFEGNKDPLLMNLRPHIFFVGYDHKPHPLFYRRIGWKNLPDGEKAFEGPEIFHLPHLPGISTSKLIEESQNASK